MLQTSRPILADLANRFPGAHIEDKGPAIAVHYRAVPEAEEEIRRLVQALADQSDGTLAAQKGKMVIELKPEGTGKGAAVERLMRVPPFAGRSPLAIGDDITDEEMFAVVNRLGGTSYRVGPAGEPTAASLRIDSPDAVRVWLASLNPGP